MSAPVRLSEVLANLLQEASRKQEWLQAWEAALPDRLKGHVVIERVTRREALLRVESPGWLYEASLERPRIHEALKRALGASAPEEIRFRLGDRGDHAQA